MASGGVGTLNWESLRYFSKVGATWTSEAIGASLAGLTTGGEFLFGLDPGGQPHLLLDQASSLLEMTRSSDGTWNSQAVTDPDFAAPLLLGKGLWLDKDNAWFIFEKVTYTLPGYSQIRAKAKVAGIWQPSILLDSFGPFPTFDAALSQDGSRLAVAIVSDRGPVVYVRTAQGWLGSAIPAYAFESTLLRAGFDGAGRLHILIQTPQAADWHE